MKNCIKADEFVYLQETGRGYEGYVEGLGYAYTEMKILNPPNLRALGWDREIDYYNRNEIVEMQYLDTSPEMVEKSLANLPKNPVHHTVRSGDTLSALAIKYGVTVSDLVKWNGMTDKNQVIRTGDKLVVGTKLSETDFIGVIAGINFAIAKAGTFLSAQASQRYSAPVFGRGGYFRNAAGRHYDLSVLKRRPQGIYKIEEAFRKAKHTTRYLRGFGYVAGGLTFGISILQFRNEQNFRNGFNVLGSAVSIVCWPVAFGVSYVNAVIDYKPVHMQRVQIQVDALEGTGKFEGESIWTRLGWIMMNSGGTLTSVTGGH